MRTFLPKIYHRMLLIFLLVVSCPVIQRMMELQRIKIWCTCCHEPNVVLTGVFGHIKLHSESTSVNTMVQILVTWWLPFSCTNFIQMIIVEMQSSTLLCRCMIICQYYCVVNLLIIFSKFPGLEQKYSDRIFSCVQGEYWHRNKSGSCKKLLFVLTLIIVLLHISAIRCK